MKKKMRKKILALLLALAVAFEGIGMIPVWAALTNSSLSTAIEMTLDTEYDVVLEEGETAWYKFVPEQTGRYTFYSSIKNESVDTYGCLYDSDGNELYGDDDGNQNSQFRIDYELYADTVYYLQARIYNDVGGEYFVVVEKDIMYANAENSEVNIEYGSTAELNVIGVSGRGQLTYTWYYSDDMEDKLIENANNSSYTVTGSIENNNRRFYCIVSDGTEEETVYFTTIIDTGLTLEKEYDEVIIKYGSNTEVVVEASGGAGELTYKWYYLNEEGSNEYIEGATSNRYTVEGTADVNNRTYYCEVSDGIVTKVYQVGITLDTGLVLENNNDEVIIKYGSNTEVVVETSGGAGELTYKWYYWNKEGNSEYIEGATSNRYTVEGTADVNNRTYYCEVSDGIVTKVYQVGITLDTGLVLENNYDGVTVKYGSSTELAVETSGGAGELTYKWYYWNENDDKEYIEGATSNRYTVEGTADVNNRTYYCEVSDGIVTEDYVAYIYLDTGLVLENNYDEVTVEYGSSTELAVETSGGAGELTYKWYYWNENDDKEYIEGATSNRYTVKGTADVNNRNYYCEVSDGIVTKEYRVYITLDTGLVLENHYDEVTVEYGSSTEVIVEASGGTGALTYKWYYLNEEGNREYIEGATSNRYTVEGTADVNNRTYCCEVSDGIATKDYEAYIYLDTGLVLENNYDEVAVEYGSSTEVIVEANGGIGALTYKWYYYNENDDIEYIEGATSNRYRVEGTADVNNRTYCCEVSDDIVTKVYQVGITLDTGLVLKNNNDEVTVEYGSSTEVVVEANGGTGALTYKWYYWNENDDKEYIEGATSNRYTVKGTADVNNRTYYCEVSDGLATKVYNVFITLDTGIVLENDYENISVEYGSSTEVVVEASGETGALTYKWYYLNEEGYKEYIEGATSNRYRVEGTADVNNMSYYCEVSDGIVTKNYEAYISLDTGLVLENDYDEVIVEYGSSTEVLVEANGGAGALTYKWYYWNENDDIEEYIEGATSNRYRVEGTADVNNRTYYCEVSDGIVTKVYQVSITLDTGLVDLSEGCTATIEYSNVVEDGKAKTPKVTVKDGNNTLVEDKHYTVEYKNNVNPGTATVAITGIGKYKGTITKTFTITKRIVKPTVTSITGATVTLSNKSYVFDGKSKTPAVKVVVGGKTLVNGNDYTVKYSKNKNIGTATVTITGKGKYRGTVTAKFNINVKVGKTYTVGTYKYKVTSKSEVAFAGLAKAKTKKVVIANSVKIGGKTFKVTSVAASALKKKKKVTSVTIGTNVKTIGKYAFNSCSKLKTITIKSTKLKSVGKNALKGINANAKIKVPAKKLKAYKKLFKGKGQGSRVKITK